MCSLFNLIVQFMRKVSEIFLKTSLIKLDIFVCSVKQPTYFMISFYILYVIADVQTLFVFSLERCCVG